MVFTTTVKRDIMFLDATQNQYEYVVTTSKNNAEGEAILQYGIKVINSMSNDEYYSYDEVFCSYTDAEKFIETINLEFIEKEQMLYILEDYLSE